MENKVMAGMVGGIIFVRNFAANDGAFSYLRCIVRQHADPLWVNAVTVSNVILTATF